MIEYTVTDETPEGYNVSARKVVFEKPYPETNEHGVIKKGVLVDQINGIGNKKAFFIEDELFIEGLYQPAIFWRLAELSENYEVNVENV